MAVRPHNDGILRQRQLSDFLYAELLHTIGAYRLAWKKFVALEKELMRETSGRRPSTADAALIEACQRAVECNKGLRLDLHRPGAPRHPAPEAKRPLSNFVPDELLLQDISTFYNVVIAALRSEPSSPDAAGGDAPEPDGDAKRLRGLLSVVHDPQRRGDAVSDRNESLRIGRIGRMEDRRRRVERLLAPDLAEAAAARTERGVSEEEFEKLLGDHVQQETSLHVTILRAMTEAHRWMHRAEHMRRKGFGEMFPKLPELHAETQRMLRYSLALNTFVFVAAKAAPWVYAEDDEERARMTRNRDVFKENCDRLTPTYCAWTATQFSLLALHRRAFTSWTMGKQDRAYRDFHKLTRLLKGLRAPAEKRASRVPGTNTFIEGMTAMAELHIGRIYRGQHAHRMALKYFDRSSRHLQGWESHEDIGEIITNSQWRINGLMNEAKAHYELGAIKHCLLKYVYAWRAFLCLSDSESHATANIDMINAFVKWLEPLVDEPELSRRELRRRIEPLVEQFETLRSPKHLERLAADIVGRIGHILYVLKLPAADWDWEKEASPKSNQDLAYRCVVKASSLDPSSTLIAADLLKIEAAASLEPSEELSAPTPLARQWPSGGGRFEEAARIIEYTLQRWLAPREDEKGGAESLEHEGEAERQVARKLLNSFLAHTDSSNMKLAQVYRYLMQGMRAKKRRTDPDQRTLDLVCMRRYSSFFPFLPRPTAFRAPGGGYFVHAREPGEDEEPFGIAIDPGPDFIENLYRCGYGLADLHMIVITHDHADHMASLDALLALMGHRRGLGDDTFEPKANRLAIVGNESIVKRYEFFDPPKGKPARKRDAVTPLSFEEIERITKLSPSRRSRDRMGKRILPMPPTLRIEPVRSWGHEDATGHISQAFQLSLGGEGARSTILFTSDTGVPEGPEEEVETRYAGGEKTVLEAAETADVVVAHLSAVPLKELRELAGLKRGEGEPGVIQEFTDLWAQACEQAGQSVEDEEDEDVKEGVQQAAFLLRQLQFGFRSRPAEGASDLEVSPFSHLDKIRSQPEQHLYLNGILEVAQRMRDSSREGAPPLLLIGELREELGTFRTRVAARISQAIFRRDANRSAPSALTADIGLRVRLARSIEDEPEDGLGEDRAITVLCTTCDLDNDLVPEERFHRPHEVQEVCVKGEDEGVFYNCLLHDPARQPDNTWLEGVERYDPFGE